MDIKKLKPESKSRYFQGYFQNATKYFGKLPIIYRSSLEFIFIQKLERNPNVDRWSSENIGIPYTLKERINGKFQDKLHTYYIDFTVIMKNGRKFLIEIKPSGLIPLTESQIHRNPAMYKNACKWKAALNYAKMNDYTFLVIDENRLKSGNIL
jgi:hypothetical protein